MGSKKALDELSSMVGELKQLSVELMNVVDQQISAVISYDEEEIERFLDEYTSLRGDFKEQEVKFIDLLQALLEESGIEHNGVQLKHLKEIYPDSADTIETWQNELGQQMDRLKKKHKKLNKLLEFAMQQNRDLMRSIYSLQDQKNTHYGASGDKEEISSGIALNKEA